MKPSVAIVMPVYNTTDVFLEASIESVLKQSYKNIKLIVVDDGSDEISTRKQIDKYKSINMIKIVHTGHNGVSSARNTGLEKSREEYILFLDSDDTLEEDYIERMVKTAEDGKYDIVFSGKKDSRTRKNDAPFMARRIDIRRDSKNIILNSQAFTSQGVLIKRKIISKERFNHTLKMGEDIDFILKIIKGKNIFYDGRGGYNYIKHENCATELHGSKDAQKYLDDAMYLIDVFNERIEVSKADIEKFKMIKSLQCLKKKNINPKDVFNHNICARKERISNLSILLDGVLTIKTRFALLLLNNNHRRVLLFLLGRKYEG